MAFKRCIFNITRSHTISNRVNLYTSCLERGEQFIVGSRHGHNNYHIQVNGLSLLATVAIHNMDYAVAYLAKIVVCGQLDVFAKQPSVE